MNSDIRKYLNLRDSLIQEKAKLETRLREINEALGQPTESDDRSTTKTRPARRGRGRRGGDGLSLREAVLQVTSQTPMTKEQILQGVKNLGYKFSTNNPLNSLGVILYGKNPKFKNEGGRFSPAGSGKASSAASTSTSASRQKRKLSPEARERIAAAQRARWAKEKSPKQS